jgi:hypothetical protein
MEVEAVKDPNQPISYSSTNHFATPENILRIAIAAASSGSRNFEPPLDNCGTEYCPLLQVPVSDSISSPRFVVLDGTVAYDSPVPLCGGI